MDAWIEQYIGIPFKIHGRTREAADCWGLVRLVLMEQYNILLPSLTEHYDTLEDTEIVPIVSTMLASKKFVRVQEPRSGDIVLLSFFGVAGHTALYVGDNYVLHTDPPGRGLSRVERLSGSRLVRRVEGYYRVE